MAISLIPDDFSPLSAIGASNENVVALKIDHAREIEFITYTRLGPAAVFPIPTVITGSIDEAFKIGVALSREVQLTGGAKL